MKIGFAKILRFPKITQSGISWACLDRLGWGNWHSTCEGGLHIFAIGLHISIVKGFVGENWFWQNLRFPRITQREISRACVDRLGRGNLHSTREGWVQIFTIGLHISIMKGFGDKIDFVKNFKFPRITKSRKSRTCFDRLGWSNFHMMGRVWVKREFCYRFPYRDDQGFRRKN